MSSVKKSKDLLSGPLLPKILIFTIPLMLSSILQLVFNAADLVVVGKFDVVNGSDSQAAISATTALIQLIINLFIGFSVGTNVVVARLIGSKNETGTRAAVQTSFIIGLIGGIAVMLIGTVFSKPLLVLMGTDPNVLELSVDYLRIYFFGAPFMVLYNTGSAVLRAYGDTKRPMLYLTAAGIINIILNLILVIRFNLGVVGVAIATSVSNLISCILIILALLKTDTVIKLDMKGFKLDKGIAMQIVKIGVPSSIQSSMFSLSNMFIQSSVNSFGAASMAGSGNAGSIEGFSYVMTNSVSQASITFTSQSVGANKTKLLNRIAFMTVMLTAAIGFITGFGEYLFKDTFMSIYSNDSAVISAGAERMSVNCTTMAICGIMDVMLGMCRGLGRSFEPMLIMLIGVCGFRIVWIYTFFQSHRSIFTLFLSYPISWGLTFAALTVCYFYYKKKFTAAIGSSKEKNAASV